MQTIALEDAPYTLTGEAERLRRTEMLALPHMQPFVDYLAPVRIRCCNGCQIPQFDRYDGGIHASALFLLEAPRPKARDAEFVSCNNPDPTARNLWHLVNDAQISRADIAIWNIVPWYVGEPDRIRPVTGTDIQEALPYLRDL